MKRTYLSMLMAIAMIASGAMTFSSCEKDPANGGENTENNGGGNNEDNNDDNNDDSGNQEDNQGGSENAGDYIDVKAGEDLQAAIDGASAGQTVRVQGGATFEGNYKFIEGVNVSGGWSADFKTCDPENYTVIDCKSSGRAWEQHRIKNAEGVYEDYVTPTIISGFELKNGNEENGGGAWIRKNGILENCYIHDCYAKSSGAGVRVETGGIVRNCIISNNTCDNNGGGAYVYGTLEYCEITFNKANNNCGGGAQIHGAGKVINCTIAKNSAKNGGGLRVYDNNGMIAGCLIVGNTIGESGKLSGSGIVLNGNCSIINCTIVGNISNAAVDTQYGPGLYFGNGGTDSPVKNCVIWGNLHSGDASGRQIKGTRTGIERCAVAGGDSVDPYVIDLSYTEETDGDRPAPGFVSAKSNIFRLKSGSPLIDKGDKAFLSEDFTKDIDGEARVSGTQVDLGAFEYQN